MNKGYFIKPTIFTDVKNDMRIAKEEIFGPVLSIIPFETEEEAIKIVNDTEYGLGNYLQTEDKERAKRVSRKLNAGIIYVMELDLTLEHLLVVSNNLEMVVKVEFGV